MVPMVLPLTTLRSATAIATATTAIGSSEGRHSGALVLLASRHEVSRHLQRVVRLRRWCVLL
jgi:hypothetical protein